MSGHKEAKSRGRRLLFQPQHYAAWGNLPADIVRGPVGQSLMADPQLEGHSRGLLRLVCKNWNQACCELTQHLAPGLSTVDENLLQLATMLPNLTSLDLSRCNELTPEAVALLLPLAGKLRAFAAGPLSLHCALFAATFSNLQSLELSSPLTEAALLLWAPVLPHLTVLKCLELTPFSHVYSGIELSDRTWRQLSHLEALIIPNTFLTISRSNIHELRAVKKLDLSRAFLDYGALAALAACSNLRVLLLPKHERVSLMNEDLAKLEQCTQLEELIVPFAPFPLITMSAVRRLRRKLPGTQVKVQFHATSEQRAKMAVQLLLIAAILVPCMLICTVTLSPALKKLLEDIRLFLQTGLFLERMPTVANITALAASVAVSSDL